MAKTFDEILLETDEEVTSAIEKIKKSKQTNIALILPRHAVLGQSIVNLKLIYRQAVDMDKSVVVISPDRIARNLADRVGFSVAEAPEEADFPAHPTTPADDAPTLAAIAKKRFDDKKIAETPAERERPDDGAVASEPPRDEAMLPEDDPTAPVEPANRERPGGGGIPTRGSLRHYRDQKRRPYLIVALTLIGLGLAGLAAAAVVGPKATITLTVKAQPFSDKVTATVATDATVPDSEKGIIPGTLSNLTVETKLSAKTTGKKDQGDKAGGSVTVFNAWDSLPHTFAAGTALVAKNGTAFVLSAELTVPPASSTIAGGTSTIVPGQKEARIEAKDPGEAGNVAATSFTISSLPKAQQEKIYATSSQALSGGISKLVGVATADDVTKLTEAAKTQNKDEATAKFKSDFQDRVVIDKAITVSGQDVTTSAKADEAADSIEATVAGRFSLITFAQKDHDQIVQKLLANKVPQGETLVTEGKGVAVDTSRFDVNLVTDTKLDLVNEIHAFTISGFDVGAIRRSLIGVRPSSEAVLKIAQKKVPATAAEIRLSPRWWPRLPFWSQKIDLDFNYTSNES